MSLGPVYGCAAQEGLTGGWGDVRELLQDVFVDLHRGWVQDYLLRPDYQTQAALLTTRGREGCSIALTHRVQSDASYVAPENLVENFAVQLVVPHRIRDGLATALMIESYASQSGFALRTDRAMRCVMNTRAYGMLALAVNAQRGLVEIFYDNTTLGLPRTNVIATFAESDFRAAMRPGDVDFDAIQRSLRTMYVGVTDSARDGIPLLAHMSNVGMLGPAFPRRGRRELGNADFYQRGVFSVHASGLPVFSTYSPVYGSRSIGVHMSAVDSMIEWGMRDALAQLSPVPQAPLPIVAQDDGIHLLDDLLLCAEQHNNARALHQLHTGRPHGGVQKPSVTRRRVLLAPAPVTEIANTTPTFAEKLDAEYRAKQELKKRRNRLAAARSNAKKSAERKRRSQPKPST